MVSENGKNEGLIYYRVSTEEQAVHGISLEQQEGACKKHAEKLGITIDRIFHDDGVSAKTTNRDGLQEMLAYCMKNAARIGSVIVYRIDRLSRNMNDYTNILVLLAKLKIKLISVTEAVDESPVGQYIGNLRAASAQFDNQMKGQRTTDCMQTKFAKGYWQWRAPVGYKNEKNDLGEKAIVPDGERAKHITWIFEEFSKGASQLTELCGEVNKRGFRTREGNKMSAQLISKIIRNRFYAGWMEAFDQEIMGVHEPIVSNDVFALCQSILRGVTREDAISYARRDEDFPLRHFVRCGYCARPLTASFSRNKAGNHYPYYRCYLKECETTVRSLPKKKLEGEFTELLEQITFKKDFSEALKEVIADVWQEQYKTINQNRTKISGELERMEGEKRKLIDMMKKDLLGEEDFKEEFKAVKEKILDTHAALTDMKLETFAVDEAVQFVFTTLEDLVKCWEDATYDQRMSLLSLIFAEKPLYSYPKFETPVLSPILETKKAFHEGKSSLVTPGRVELPLRA